MKFESFSIGMFDLFVYKDYQLIVKIWNLLQRSTANKVPIEKIGFYRNDPHKRRVSVFDMAHKKCNYCLNHRIYPYRDNIK